MVYFFGHSTDNPYISNLNRYYYDFNYHPYH